MGKTILEGTRVHGNASNDGTNALGNYNDAGDSSSFAAMKAMMSQGFTQDELEYGTGQSRGNFDHGDAPIFAGNANAGLENYGAPGSIPTPPRAAEPSVPHKDPYPGK